MARKRPRKPPQPPYRRRPTTPDIGNTSLDSGVYAVITALTEAAFGPVERLPDRCREFGDMAFQFRDAPDMATGLHSALATLLLTAKRSLALTGNASLLAPDQVSVEMALFQQVVGDAPQMSVEANRVLALMMEHENQSTYLKEMLTYIHRTHGGPAGAFEVLARLLPVIVDRHGPGTDWQRWHVTAQLVATSFPTQLSRSIPATSQP